MAGHTWSGPSPSKSSGRGLVKVRDSIDGHPFRSSFMAMVDGRHMLPVKADVHKATGKRVGVSVTVCLQELLDR